MKKKLIKVAIVFILMMIFFTILSRAADQFTIAKVMTTEAKHMSIEHSLIAPGKVSHNQVQIVSTVSNQVVANVFVSIGERVTAGTVLFKVKKEELGKQISALQLEIDSLNLSIQDTTSTQSSEKKRNELAIKRAKEDLVQVRDEGNAKVSKASEELQEAKTKYDEYKKNPSSMADVTATELNAVKKEKQNAFDEEVVNRDKNNLAAQRALEDANNATITTSSIASTTLEKEQKLAEKTRLEALQSVDGAITAPIDGVVTKVNMTEGDRTTDASTIALADLSAGMQLKVQISAEDESFLNGEGVISVTGENSQTHKQEKIEKLTIASVKEDNEKNMIEVIIKLPKDSLSYGSDATLQIVNSSSKFNYCVPLQAVRQSNDNKYFILIIDEKDSILGKEYIASKIDVTILDKNGQYAAIEGPTINALSKIIISSDKPIGERIRVKVRE